MTEFTYKNAKNASTGHTSFKLNCRFQRQVSFKEDNNLYSKFRLGNK